jgi:hypothetical protein
VGILGSGGIAGDGSGQFHASVALPPGKETPVPVGEEAVWAPQPV